MSLQDEQAPIDMEIVKAAVSSTIDDWNDFFLYLEYEWADDPDELGNVKVSLQNNNEKNGFETPNDNLFLAVQKLNKLFYRYGVAWISAKYRISLNESGNWEYKAEFQY